MGGGDVVSLARGLCVCCDGSGRRLSGVGRTPIRITFDTTAVTSSSSITASQQTLVINYILPAVQSYMSSLLSVDA